MSNERPGVLERISGGRTGNEIAATDLPGYLLGVILAAAFLAEAFTGGPTRWALSAHALAEGRFETLLTHMFSHAGLGHLLANTATLVGVSGPVAARLGLRSPGMFRFALLFLLSGLSGAAMFLLMHPSGVTPMVGASGAICGLWGAAMRLPSDRSAPLRGLISREMLKNLRGFAVSNVLLFGLLAFASEGKIWVAWEAHLGGLLFGLFALPAFLHSVPPPPQETRAG